MKRCEDCTFVRKFNPRKDELERGLTMGCTYPGWEGYVKSSDAEKCTTYNPRIEQTAKSAAHA